eukprot:CAMPEP_0201281450 /NCGR_PEP_ID=MMETSP1317-20130820/2744_1 /ASSEMBLY_ACC=CAM_ASM_000770 /TAXON_ID=187299 /ORGANISM="Undescribed Undescribed, Strain Undescribed" /LENGTH=126 /DNA_ID=CAMNT_0047591233 /DNA_START=327 /DNA_END=707 /DNA_ORIENTATION=-
MHALPKLPKFIVLMRKLRVKKDLPIVLYHRNTEKVLIGRAWLMLVSFGATDVSILDGGIALWKVQGRQLESGQYRVYKKEDWEDGYDYSYSEELFATKEDVVDAIKHGHTQLLDSRTPEEFQCKVA